MSKVSTRSIRSKIVTLLSVPLLSLAALWMFAASITVDEAWDQRHAERSLDRMGNPVQDLVFALGAERRESAAAVGIPTGDRANARARIEQTRQRTDTTVAAFRSVARQELGSTTDRGAVDTRLRLLNEALRSLDNLKNVRDAVDGQAMDRVRTIDAYSASVDAIYEFADKQTVTDDGALNQWSSSLVSGVRAMDMIMRESALVAGAENGRLGRAEHRRFVELVGRQRLLWENQVSLMPPDSFSRVMRPRFTSAAFTTFKEIENTIVDNGDRRGTVSVSGWSATVEPLLNELNLAHKEAANDLQAAQTESSNAILLRAGLAGGLGLVAAALSIWLSVRFGRGLIRELVALRHAAQETAERRLPSVVDRLVRGERVDVEAEAPPPPASTTAEIAQVAAAFGAMQRTAVGAAVGQAELREGVRHIFLNIARRNQSLLHRQLKMLDELESRAEADDLAELFKLDHLTTRMRRHAESLIILSGATPGRGWRRPVAIADVLRGAVGEVEDYTRVSVLTECPDGLVGAAVTDVIHLLAELLENATSFSPPGTEIRMMAERVGNGFVIEIEDRGLGIAPDELDRINRRLAAPPEFDLVDTDQLGLFVVARLAVRHNVQVSLRRSPYGGISAIVLLPHDLVVPAEEFDAHAEEETPALEAGAPAGTPELVAPVPDTVPDDGPAPAPEAEPEPDPEPERHAPVLPLPGAAAEPVFAPYPEPDPVRDFEPWPAPEPDPPLGQEPPAAPFTHEPFPAEPPAAGRPVPAWEAPTAENPTQVSPVSGNPWFDDVSAVEARWSDGAQDRPHDDPAFVPDTPDATPEEPPAEDTHAGLPRRRRQANLAPQLRAADRPLPPPVEENAHGVVVRSPEEARSLMSSIQQGWRRGRADHVNHEDDHEGEGTR